MRAVVVFSSLWLTVGLAFAGSDVASTSGHQSISKPDTRMRVAQNCGYFAILGCFTTRAEALNWNARIDQGHVIDTSREAYPNFRPGYFCVAAGPTSKDSARSIANGWHDVIPDAYVKNSC